MAAIYRGTRSYDTLVLAKRVIMILREFVPLCTIIPATCSATTVLEIDLHCCAFSQPRTKGRFVLKNGLMRKNKKLAPVVVYAQKTVDHKALRRRFQRPLWKERLLLCYEFGAMGGAMNSMNK